MKIAGRSRLLQDLETSRFFLEEGLVTRQALSPDLFGLRLGRVRVQSTKPQTTTHERHEFIPRRSTGPGKRIREKRFEHEIHNKAKTVATEPGSSERRSRLAWRILAPTLPCGSVSLRRAGSPQSSGRGAVRASRSGAGAWERDQETEKRRDSRQSLEIRPMTG